MKKILPFIFIIIADFIFTAKTHAQTLPVGSCGIVYTYDAAGNRTKREYICNNGLVALQQAPAENEKISTTDIIKTDILYPNPTTGIFSIRLVKPLSNAIVTVIDASGQILLKKTENGNILTYDLSGKPSGEYLVTIKQNQQSITMKVIKAK